MAEEPKAAAPRTEEELRAARARAGELAGELQALLGDRPSTVWTAGGAVRVSVRLRGPHGTDLAMSVLAVLGRADRYGHRKGPGREQLWLEIGGVPTEDHEW
ncbi:hypothetical protein [Kitasatospora phosalacinea]|uniref:hypothetical protein n=1 Tax=Kitasatospora phosalacinea TaxID=2065 RepID=UPI00052526F3|nr:hypothetical protein [Kitasatospora phosalacinea]